MTSTVRIQWINPKPVIKNDDFTTNKTDKCEALAFPWFMFTPVLAVFSVMAFTLAVMYPVSLIMGWV